MGTLRGLHTPEDAEQRAIERREKVIVQDILSDFMTSSDECYDFLLKQRSYFIKNTLDPFLLSLGLKKLGSQGASGVSNVPGNFVHRVLYSGPENCILIVDLGLPAYFSAEVLREEDAEPYPECVETALRVLSRVSALSDPSFKDEENEEPL
jgi:hypothetical protein